MASVTPESPRIDVEYCGQCNFAAECAALKQRIESAVPEARVRCSAEGARRGAFEVRINDQLVHSKLQSLAFPSPDAVAANVQRAREGLPVEGRVAELPITDCVLQ